MDDDGLLVVNVIWGGRSQRVGLAGGLDPQEVSRLLAAALRLPPPTPRVVALE
ncbi:unnamed protein product, partial [Heterosigma akashiwo]